MGKKISRVLMITAVVVALIVSSMALVACSGGQAKGLRKTSDIFALAGVSTGAILSDMAAENGKVAMAGEEVVDRTVIDELDEYMSLVDTLVKGAPETSKATKSDREGYTTMQVMNVPMMDGKYTEYKLYYNEDAKAREVEEDDEEEEESEEDEYEAHITGVMVIGENEFPVKGDIEREADEQEIEFKAYLNEDKTDYIELSQETETNESEFEYKIYKNGAFESSFSVEFETEDKESEFELELEDKSGTAIKYEITYKSDDKIEVEYTKNGETGIFDVVASVDADGNTTYKYFSRGTEIDRD